MTSERPPETPARLSEPISRMFWAPPALGSLVGDWGSSPAAGSSASCLTLLVTVWFRKARYAAAPPTTRTSATATTLIRTRRRRRLGRGVAGGFSGPRAACHPAVFGGRPPFPPRLRGHG